MYTLEKITALNPDKTIVLLTDTAFSDYGDSVTQYDDCEHSQYLELTVPIPAPTAAHRVIPTHPAMEKLPVDSQIGRDVFAGLHIEAGECAGHAEALTAVELLTGSEVNVFYSDVVMVIGKRGQMHDGTFNAEKDE